MSYLCSRKGDCCPLLANWFYYVAGHGISLDPDNPNEAFFIFPGMQAYVSDSSRKKGQTLSSYVSEILKREAEKNKLDYLVGKTAKGFRIGPINIVCISIWGGFDIANFLGGWGAAVTLKNGSLGEYFDQDPILIAIGARILGGYRFPRLMYPQPWLCFIEPNDDILKSQIDRFLTIVLSLEQHHVNLRPQGSAYPYIKRLFANFLMRFQEVN